jgi:hypothetical protein
VLVGGAGLGAYALIRVAYGTPEQHEACLREKNAVALAEVTAAVPLGTPLSQVHALVDGMGSIDGANCQFVAADGGRVTGIACPVWALCDPGLVGGTVTLELDAAGLVRSIHGEPE